MSSYNFEVIQNETNEKFRNLVGVFHRVFPIATGMVNGIDGKTITVTYYGETYTIQGKAD